MEIHDKIYLLVTFGFIATFTILNIIYNALVDLNIKINKIDKNNP